jgi:GntR family histidine utilization transcriptional repressor
MSLPAEDLAQPTLNQRIRADLESRILSGDLKPGDRIPYEHELMVAYGCSRMTVNKVLTALVEAGLIERRRRAGSFVRRPVALSAVLTIQDIQAEIRDRGEAYRFELMGRVERVAGKADRELLGVERGTRVVALRCRHFAGGRPFALESRLLNLAAVPEAAGVDFTAEPPGTWLLGHVPWTEAEHRIAAVQASFEVADALDLPEGTACLVVRRRTFRSKQTVTAVTLTYPGDRHELVARFTP